MAAPHSVDPAALLEQPSASASSDLLREMITTFANALMSAQADQVCGAEYGERSAERANHATATGPGSGTPAPARSSSRSRSCVQGSYFPDWLLTHRRRAEQALVTVVATATCSGSRPGGWRGWPSSSGSSPCRAPRSARWPRTSIRRSRRSAHRPAGRRAVHVRVGRRADGEGPRGTAGWSTCTPCRDRVNADGTGRSSAWMLPRRRTAPGGWRSCCGLVARGLSGVQLVISDAHPGWSRRSGRRCPARPGNGVAPTTCAPLTRVPKTAPPVGVAATPLVCSSSRATRRRNRGTNGRTTPTITPLDHCWSAAFLVRRRDRGSRLS